MCARMPLGSSCSRLRFRALRVPLPNPRARPIPARQPRPRARRSTVVVRNRGSVAWNCLTIRVTSVRGIAAFPSATASVSARGRRLEVDVLDQIADRARTEGAEEARVLLGDGKHHNLGGRQARSDLPGRRHAAAGHPKIEQADVGLRLERLLSRRGRRSPPRRRRPARLSASARRTSSRVGAWSSAMSTRSCKDGCRPGAFTAPTPRGFRCRGPRVGCAASPPSASARSLHR